MANLQAQADSFAAEIGSQLAGYLKTLEEKYELVAKRLEVFAKPNARKVGLPRFGGQASGLHVYECMGVDGDLLVVNRAEGHPSTFAPGRARRTASAKGSYST